MAPIDNANKYQDLKAREGSLNEAEKKILTKLEQNGYTPDKAAADLANPQYQADHEAWKEGSANRIAAHAIVGGLTGGVQGALGQGTTAAAAPLIEQLTEGSNLSPQLKKVLGGALALTIGATVGGTSGAIAGLNGEVNNRQLHPNERKWAKDNAAKYRDYLSSKTGENISTEEAYQRLLSAGYAVVDTAAANTGKSDETAKQFINQNSPSSLFTASAAERANPFLGGNKDGSFSPEQQARYGVKNPTELANRRIEEANKVVGKPCDITSCNTKVDAIAGAVSALEQEKALYKNDPARVAQIELQQNQLLSGLTKKDIETAQLANADAAFMLDLTLTSQVPSLINGVARSNLLNQLVKRTEGANGGVNPTLLNELTANGVKFTPENVIATARSPSGQVVFLETGSPTAGLRHIVQEHGPEFANMGVSEAQIPSVVMRAVTEGRIVGYQGSGTGRPIYELTINGQTQRIAITTSNNGFIVGANPRGTGK